MESEKEANSQKNCKLICHPVADLLMFKISFTFAYDALQISASSRYFYAKFTHIEFSTDDDLSN